MIRIGLVAGEASGDLLGAGLLKELNKRSDALSIEGIGGEQLSQLDMRILFPMERLSVMGFTEVLGRYFELKKIRDDLLAHFIKNPPDVFIGIDAPDFNLWLEKKLRKAGIKTVHYVSPSVWAWREYRIKKIHLAADLILNLFPFETPIYDKYKIPNKYVGHPLADRLPIEPDQAGARAELGLPHDKIIVALLPGSRISEINRIAGPLLQAADLSSKIHPNLHFVSGLNNDKTLETFEGIKKNVAPNLKVSMTIGNTHRIMESADVIMLASGTATLEAMLYKKPMVVAYRLSFLTHFIVKLLAKIPYASIPNILAGKVIVPECLQSRCTPKLLSAELNKLLQSEEEIIKMKSAFNDLSTQLRMNADMQAAEAVLGLIDSNDVN